MDLNIDNFKSKIKIDIDGTVEADCPEVELPKPKPQQFDWIHHVAEKDIREMQEALNVIGNHLEHMRWRAEQDSKAVEELRQEKWRDEQLQDLKRQRDEALEDTHRGFPITKQQMRDINEWQTQHDTVFHSNPNRYHGAAGGGYEYTFYPTGIGTSGECICCNCKSHAIAEAGVNWYKKLKEWGGVYEFQRLG